MAVEVAFGFVHFFSVDKAGMAKARIGECIHYRASYEYGQGIIHQCSCERAGGCHKHYREYVHVALLYGKVCRRWHNHFGRERYERAFYHHEYEHEQIVGVFNEPVEEPGGIEVVGYGKRYEKIYHFRCGLIEFPNFAKIPRIHAMCVLNGVRFPSLRTSPLPRWQPRHRGRAVWTHHAPGRERSEPLWPPAPHRNQNHSLILS